MENNHIESLEKLESLLKSDSVYYALRFAYKSPSRCGVDDCEDNDYLELYEICKALRQQLNETKNTI